MELVLGRVGHYFNSGNGSCSTAVVVDVVGEAQIAAPARVNITGWSHDGEGFKHLDVPAVPAPTVEDTASSFHLTRDCPWSR